ncbi:hypothetical protein M3Y97_00250300 [Aphelenchoides bicaudatus]|nr:hypothetical protein M3Y97_00250300 [Aphelenchoides bicaudatus]
MSYLFLLLLLSVLPRLTQCEVEEKIFFSCSNRYWACIAERVDESPTLNQLPHFSENPVISGRRRKPPNIYFSYLNKVDLDTGSIYVAARLKFEVQQISLQNATGMSLQILPKDPYLKPIYYYAQISQNRAVGDGVSLDFTFPIEKLLEHEQQYTLKFDLLPLHLGISSKKPLVVPSYTLPEIECNKGFEPDDKRQQITSRFTSSFRQLTFYPYHSTVNLSFFAAPRPYCLSYEVQLSLGGSHIVESHIIHASDMQVQENGNRVLIGTVTLTKIVNDQSYSLRLIPYSATNSCVCLDCSCMFVESQVFSLPKTKDERDKSKPASSTSKTKTAQSSSKQFIRIEIVDDRIEKTNNMFMLIAFFCILSLTFITIALIILVCKTNFRANPLILIKAARISQQQKPLLKLNKSNQTILILNAEPSKSNLVALLANMFEQSDHKIHVVCLEKSQKAIERNVQAFCQDVLSRADKIILFHSNRAAYLLSHNVPALANQSAIFDSAFQAFMSFVRINDSRFIHTCWNNQKVTLFHNIETIYTLPRDLHFIFDIVKAVPTFEQCAKFQDEYQKTTQPVEEKSPVLQAINVESSQIIAQTVVDSAKAENEPFDSGFVTFDSSEHNERALDEENKDLLSVGSSEDSGIL